MNRLWLVIFALFSCSSFTAGGYYTAFFSNNAVSGYDTVSFFDGIPLKGKSDFSAHYEGAVWLFHTQENLDKFTQSPSQYAPQYGGYCAWAIAKNDNLAPGNPLYWKTVNNKLYLNYDQKIQELWEKNMTLFIESGDKNWSNR